MERLRQFVPIDVFLSIPFFFIFILVFGFFFFPSCLIFFLYARNRRWAPVLRYTRDDFSDTDNGSPQLITITIYNTILCNTRYRYDRRWYNIYSNELQLHANYYYYMHFLFLKYSISWQTNFCSFAFVCITNARRLIITPETYNMRT